MRILIHTADRQVFVYDAYPRRLLIDLFERLMAQLQISITHDDAEGHKFHGNQYIKVAVDPKPLKHTQPTKKQGIAQMLASGHSFSVEELMEATGATKAQVQGALSNLKKETPVGALYLHKDPKTGMYSVKMQTVVPAEVKPVPIAAPEAPAPSPEVTSLLDPKSVAKAPDVPLGKTEANAIYEKAIESTLAVVGAIADPAFESHYSKLAQSFKDAKAQAMAQWAANTTGKDVAPKPQQVFKADIELVKQLAEKKLGSGTHAQKTALAEWKKNSAGEKAGTWPPDPFKAALAAEAAAAEKAKKEALFATMVHGEPTFPTVPDYSPKGHAHIGIDDFTSGETTGKSKFEKGIGNLKDSLSSGHPNAVTNKVGVQKSLENRLAISKSFQALVTQRKANGNGGSLVASLISAWAGSSGDHQPVSVANQLSIRDAFDMPHESVATDALHLIVKSKASEQDVYNQAAAHLGLKHDTEEQRATLRAGLRDFALAQYHETQEHFKQLGIKDVYVARGMKLQPGDKAEHGKLRLQPASSFSANYDTAQGFSAGLSTFLVKVPASQVLSTYVTGFGCTNEHEVVVLAHPDTEAIKVKAQGSLGQARTKIVKDLSAPSAAAVALEQYEKAKASAHATKPAAKAAPAGGEVKNAYYYQKLSKAVKAHPAHNEVAYEALKKAGMSHEKILANYNKQMEKLDG